MPAEVPTKPIKRTLVPSSPPSPPLARLLLGEVMTSSEKFMAACSLISMGVVWRPCHPSTHGETSVGNFAIDGFSMLCIFTGSCQLLNPKGALGTDCSAASMRRRPPQPAGRTHCSMSAASWTHANLPAVSVISAGEVTLGGQRTARAACGDTVIFVRSCCPPAALQDGFSAQALEVGLRLNRCSQPFTPVVDVQWPRTGKRSCRT